MIRITAIPSSSWRRSISARIWAWIVTSSAVVGSSAIRSFGLVGERHRDHRALAHPARELVRVVVDAALRVGDPDQPEQLDRAPSRAACLGTSLVGLDRLDDLVADLVERVQRGQRVLEDHRDLVAAHARAARSVVELAQVAALEHDPARDPRVRRPGQAQDRQVGDALAAARLADDAERLAVLDRERDAVDGLDDAVLGLEAGPEVVDLEQRLTGSAPAGRGRRRAMSTIRLKMTMKKAPNRTMPWISGQVGAV